MRFVSLLVLLASSSLAIGACAGAPPSSTEATPNEAPSSDDSTVQDSTTVSASEPNDERDESRFAVGDFVIYQYSGSYAEEPTFLREIVVDVDGIRLTIEVEAVRGGTQRKWIQVVTDTEDNRANNVVDALYEVVNGERIALANENNADVMRLYEWTLPACGPPVVPLASGTREITFAGRAHACECDRSNMQCADAAAVMEACTCEDFVWRYTYGAVIPSGQSEPYWMVQVMDTGRE